MCSADDGQTRVKRTCCYSILKVPEKVASQKKESAKRRFPDPRERGCSSAGRAPALHAGGQEFDPPHLHQGDVETNERPAFSVPSFAIIVRSTIMGA